MRSFLEESLNKLVPNSCQFGNVAFCFIRIGNIWEYLRFIHQRACKTFEKYDRYLETQHISVYYTALTRLVRVGRFQGKFESERPRGSEVTFIGRANSGTQSLQQCPTPQQQRPSEFRESPWINLEQN